MSRSQTGNELIHAEEMRMVNQQVEQELRRLKIKKPGKLSPNKEMAAYDEAHRIFPAEYDSREKMILFKYLSKQPGVLNELQDLLQVLRKR